MKRDLDLARNILLAIENNENATGPDWKPLTIPGYSQEQVSYHIMLLDEAGLIEAEKLTTFDGFKWEYERLTWQGHEFLDSARDENLWKQAKNKLEEIKNPSFEVLKTVLIKLAERSLDGS